MRWVALVMLPLAACGRIGFGSFGDDTGAGDGRLGDGAGFDITFGNCWSAWTTGPLVLSTPQLVPSLAGSESRDPSPTHDALGLYYARGAPGLHDFYYTMRVDRYQPFSSPTLQSDVSSPADDSKLALSNNDLLAVWASNRAGGGSGFDLYEAVRSDVASAFGTPSTMPFAMVNDNNEQLDPFVSVDGLRVYLAPTVAISMQSVVMSSRTSQVAPFGAPVAVGGLVESITADPTLSPDELVIVYSGQSVSGATLHLYYATRPSTSVAFGNAAMVPNISAAADDGDPALTFDGCELYFSSLRDGQYQIYVSVVQ